MKDSDVLTKLQSLKCFNQFPNADPLGTRMTAEPLSASQN